MAGLRLYTSNRLEILAQRLAEILKRPLASPLDKEVIVVQSKGMERWVRMELALYHGICANLRLLFPNAMMHEIFREAFKDLPEDSFYNPAIMTWKIMNILPARIKMPGFEGIRSYLGDHIRHLKWFQLSERIADTFDQYLIFRPEMILSWEEGKGDHWQALLWRELVKGHEKSHRAVLKKAFMDLARKRSISMKNLAQRISIFGISSLPSYHMDVFAALSWFVDMNLFLMNPCKEYWVDIVSDREMKRFIKDDKRHDLEDELHLERGNTLLASMGHQGREFFSLITKLECEEHEFFQDAGSQDILSCIQSDILFLRETVGEPEQKKMISEDDTSIQVHSCHGPMREMEVLYDNLLSMFEKYPDIAPKDILVMTPDIETYAPFIQAVFGVADEDRKRIPFSIADRRAKSENQLAGAFFAILDLCDSRFGAREVLSLLEYPSIRQRFHLSEEDIPLIHRWVTETGIRWGIDAQHREEIGLPPFSENTWRFGLDRLLLGYAMPMKEERIFKGILPYGFVEGGDAQVLGKLAEFAETLFYHVVPLNRARPLDEWSKTLTAFLDRFFLPAKNTEREIQMIRGTLHDLAGQKDISGFHQKVELEVIKAYLVRHLEKEGYGSGFIAGGITFCAMLPMRSIPFKAICLVGMNNNAYPRQTKTLGFDLIAKHPRWGDRSVRKDDRYLFLETILSARKALYISYVGQSPQDNSQISPSVLVSELIDYLEAQFTIPGKDLTGHIITNHRLQAFSTAYFSGPERLFTYSGEDLQAARRALEVRRAPRPFISTGLTKPPTDREAIDLGQAIGFFANPAQTFLKQRLGIRLERSRKRLDEIESFEVEGLDRYHLEQLLVEKGVSGSDIRDILPVIGASGQLPHGVVGECVLEKLSRGALEFVDTIKMQTGKISLEPIDLSLHLSQFDLRARISSVYPDSLVQYRYSRLKAKDHLKMWLSHLLLNAFGPEDYPKKSMLLGKGELWLYSPLRESEKTFERLLEVFLQGLRKPIHFFPESSLKYAEELIRNGKQEHTALQHARNTWYGTEYQRGECQDDYYIICFGNTDPLDDEFKELAVDIYVPLLECRKKVSSQKVRVTLKNQ